MNNEEVDFVNPSQAARNAVIHDRDLLDAAIDRSAIEKNLLHGILRGIRENLLKAGEPCGIANVPDFSEQISPPPASARPSAYCAFAATCQDIREKLEPLAVIARHLADQMDREMESHRDAHVAKSRNRHAEREADRSRSKERIAALYDEVLRESRELLAGVRDSILASLRVIFERGSIGSDEGLELFCNVYDAAALVEKIRAILKDCSVRYEDSAPLLESMDFLPSLLRAMQDVAQHAADGLSDVMEEFSALHIPEKWRVSANIPRSKKRERGNGGGAVDRGDAAMRPIDLSDLERLASELHAERRLLTVEMSDHAVPEDCTLFRPSDALAQGIRDAMQQLSLATWKPGSADGNALYLQISGETLARKREEAECTALHDLLAQIISQLEFKEAQYAEQYQLRTGEKLPHAQRSFWTQIFVVLKYMMEMLQSLNGVRPLSASMLGRNIMVRGAHAQTTADIALAEYLREVVDDRTRFRVFARNARTYFERASDGPTTLTGTAFKQQFLRLIENIADRSHDHRRELLVEILQDLKAEFALAQSRSPYPEGENSKRPSAKASAGNLTQALHRTSGNANRES